MLCRQHEDKWGGGVQLHPLLTLPLDGGQQELDALATLVPGKGPQKTSKQETECFGEGETISHPCQVSNHRPSSP